MELIMDELNPLNSSAVPDQIVRSTSMAEEEALRCEEASRQDIIALESTLSLFTVVGG
jgi:hypothetical protein